MPQRPTGDSSVMSFPTTHHPDAHERELRTQQLLEEAAHADPDRRQQLWDDVVLLNRGAALSIANRYRGRGIDADDLEQVALLGLVKAVHGFKVGEGPGFLAYAVPPSPVRSSGTSATTAGASARPGGSRSCAGPWPPRSRS